MAYPIRHKLLTFIGGYGTTNEEWSFGLRIIPPIDSLTVSQAQVDSLATAASNFITSTSCNFPLVYKLLAIKLAPIGTNGHYPDGEISYEHAFTSVAGSGDTAALQAPQVSLVATLLTAVPRGRGSRGRIYLPPRSNSLGTDGRLGSGQQDFITTPLRTLILAINAASGVGTVGLITKVGEFGTSHAVTGVKVGRVYDTQRRRRRSLDEDYHTLAI